MRMLIVRYPNGEIKFWVPEEFQPDSNVQLLGIALVPYSELSESEPV